MDNNSILFEGNARVYLQGKNALQVIPQTGLSQGIRYCIGDPSSQFFIHDFRTKSVIQAWEAIHRGYQNGFAKSFNQVSWVKILYDQSNKEIEIEIRDKVDRPSQVPVLWMGILENHLMQGYEVEWEMFKYLDSQNTAFVALIPQAI